MRKIIRQSSTARIISLLVISELYFVVFKFVLKPFGLFTSLASFGKLAPIMGIFVQEIPIILIWLLVNRFIWKQKILFQKYPLIKSLLVMSFAIFSFIMGLTAIFRLHVSWGFLVLTFLACLLIGLAEEFLFRGLIFSGLIQSGRSLLFSVLLTSLLFGLWHSTNAFSQPLYDTFLQVLYVIPLGAFLAAVYLKTNNFIYPLLLHAMIDFNSISNTYGQLSSLRATPMTVLLDYLLFGFLAWAFIYSGKQQNANFVSRLRGEPIQPVSRDLPSLAKNGLFQKVMTSLMLLYGLIFMWGFGLFLEAVFKKVSQLDSLKSTQSLPLQANTGILLDISILLGLAILAFVILFFNFRWLHLLWWLIPLIGLPIIALLMLTGAIRPKSREEKPFEKLKISYN